MALERLQALATACIPDLDRLVVRRRRISCISMTGRQLNLSSFLSHEPAP
jgi:hypothetical protein